ncbi:MAG TPA: methyltransferase domain-containing protein [Anaerolineales bacterium]|nr:methyltransferase domain-containing protein [Anaerolineales bacterium]
MPMDLDTAHRLRHGTHQAYSAAAQSPTAEHPFPVGEDFALSLGYPPELLASLPRRAAAAFTGVANLHSFAEIPPGSVVLDLGCGAGLDSLIASRRTGPGGVVIAVDFSSAMLSSAHQSLLESRLGNIELLQSNAESMPLTRGQIDVVLVNGIFNLNPWREAIFHELARLLRPGGRLYAAELILKAPLPPEEKPAEDDWFA